MYKRQLYGLRRNEVLGLRWSNVDLRNKRFAVVEQLPFKVPPGTTEITEMAPTKSQDRILPITDVTLPFFIRQQQLQQKQKELADCLLYTSRFSSLATEGKLLSMSVWENEECVSKWRNFAAHRMAQKHGRMNDFADYKITVDVYKRQVV